MRTKLATRGAPGTAEQGADTLAWCCTQADLSEAAYYKDRRPTSVPQRLGDVAVQDALLAACDDLAGLGADAGS